MSVGKRAAWILSLCVLAFTGVMGLYNGTTEWSGAQTVQQTSVEVGVFFYGLLGMAGFVGLLRRKSWASIVVLAWGLVVTYVAGVAVLAYGDDNPSVLSALAAASGAALIGAAVFFASKAVTGVKRV
jgi:hypothetical protein